MTTASPGCVPQARHDGPCQQDLGRVELPAPDVARETGECLLVVGQLRVPGVAVGDHPRQHLNHRRHRAGVHLRDEHRQYVGAEACPFDAAASAELLQGDIENGHARDSIATACSLVRDAAGTANPQGRPARTIRSSWGKVE